MNQNIRYEKGWYKIVSEPETETADKKSLTTEKSETDLGFEYIKEMIKVEQLSTFRFMFNRVIRNQQKIIKTITEKVGGK